MSLIATRLARAEKFETTVEDRTHHAMCSCAFTGRIAKRTATAVDRDSSNAEVEFTAAIQAYKISSGRMFPTWSEVLEVLTTLGYQKSPRGRLL